MKLVLASDNHNRDLSSIVFPDGDLLLHCGDLTMNGTIPEVSRALLELSNIATKYKYGCVFIAGNHDWLFEKNPALALSIVKEYSNLTYLHDETITIENLKIFGSPYQPEFCQWAFNEPRGHRLRRHWDLIEPRTDIIMTHGPVSGIHDYIPWDNEYVGCVDLRHKVLEIKPKLFVCGHIHLNGGKIEEFNGIKFVNASICDESYKPVNNPIVIEL